MDRDGQHSWQSEEDFSREVKCEVVEEEYLDEYRQEIAPPVNRSAYMVQLPKLRPRPATYQTWDEDDLPMPKLERRAGLPPPPTLEPRPGYFHMPIKEEPESSPMPELEGRPGLPDMPTLVRALEAEPRPAQEGQSLEPTMPEFDTLGVAQEGQSLEPTMPEFDTLGVAQEGQSQAQEGQSQAQEGQSQAQEGQSLVPTMSELERLLRLPAFPTPVRAQEGQSQGQEGQSLVPATPELDRRPRLPDMPILEGMASHVISIPARNDPQSEAPMPETERQPGQLDVPIPEAMSGLGPPLVNIQVDGLEAPVEVRLVSIETMEYWPQEILTPEELARAGMNPQPVAKRQPVPKRQPASKRQPVQFVGQKDQPGHSRTGKRRPATPLPRKRSAVSSSTPQAGPSELVPPPSAQSTSRQIEAQPQPSTSGKRPPMNGRVTVDRGYVAMVSGISETDMRSFPAHVEFVLDERSTLLLVYRCSVCEVEFTDLKSYNNHTRMEHKRAFCPGCHRSLMMGSMDRHLKACPAVACVCRVCAFKTARPCELQQHLREVHQLPGPRCQSRFCQFCDRVI
ncbi:protein piccolo-like [Anopheles ziemanni]|uniref:protein piccolo-like n=1 Tax=Anopheles coustani TaxID=139045 RepID=UPI00265AACA6|nr:protein piccolo-like [Anopheles coustani]XP_058176332.1 protein piccolo-like [Anopheles ziemanni]